MKILLTGGGTGGHITPILAVAHELKILRSDCKTIYVGERGSKFAELTANHAAIDEIYTVSAGKYRRYHGESWLRRVADIKTNLLNLRDLFRFIAGSYQSWRLLRKIRPDIVFLKGGFVGVPIGLAAAMLHIPIITHDSDAVPGLANRLVSRWVSWHATALPAEYYPYPKAKIQPVGVLVEHNYQNVSAMQQKEYKLEIGVPVNSSLLLITGGSSGADRINRAVVKIIEELLQKYPELYAIHQAGKGKMDVYGAYKHDRLRVLEFLNPMHVFMGAADLVVARSSANTLAELGTQGKACIVVPSAFLTGGHQLKNAHRLEEQGAAIIVHDDQLYDLQHGLFAAVTSLLSDKAKRNELSLRLRDITLTGAAKRLANLILDNTQTK